MLETFEICHNSSLVALLDVFDSALFSFSGLHGKSHRFAEHSAANDHADTQSNSQVLLTIFGIAVGLVTRQS
jgi:hypothetical protein